MEKMNDYLRLNLMKNNINKNSHNRRTKGGNWKKGGRMNYLNTTYFALMTCDVYLPKIISERKKFRKGDIESNLKADNLFKTWICVSMDIHSSAPTYLSIVDLLKPHFPSHTKRQKLLFLSAFFIFLLCFMNTILSSDLRILYYDK